MLQCLAFNMNGFLDLPAGHSKRTDSDNKMFISSEACFAVMCEMLSALHRFGYSSAI